MVTDISNDERRDYYRISDTVGFTCAICKNENEIPSMAEFIAEIPDEFQLINQLSRIDMESSALLHTIQETSPDISRYLRILNSKVEAIARHIVSFGLTDEIKLEKVTLSAGGLSLITNEVVALGCVLRKIMILYPCCSVILTYGKFVGCRAIPDTTPPQFDTALEYILINESDRDVLVRHALQLQSNQLRQKK